MPALDVVIEYLKLGLRFDRVVDGFVDAYIGDPALRREVADEPAPDPADLSVAATRLSAAVPDAGLSDARAGYLIAHLDALAVAGRRLAGEQMSFVDEVRAYFQVDIARQDTDVYAAAHRAIAALLDDAGIPRSGTLGERLAAQRARETCPPADVEPAVRALAAALRGRVATATGLPPTENIEFEVQRDVSWSGFNYYLGNFSSRVAVNADIGHRMSQLPVLVAHECYPGHHTEHCRKEELLVRRGGELEQTIFLVNTPQCLMAEGLGDLALTAAVGPGWGAWAAEVLDGFPRSRPPGEKSGPAFEPELAEALEIAARPLNTVRQNVAIMVHDGGLDAGAALDYLQSWALVDRDRAQQILRFTTDPLWRAYTSTYVEGERLLRPWLAARSAGQSALDRFQRLLDEPLTPSAIAAELRDGSTVGNG